MAVLLVRPETSQSLTSESLFEFIPAVSTQDRAALLLQTLEALQSQIDARLHIAETRHHKNASEHSKQTEINHSRDSIHKLDETIQSSLGQAFGFFSLVDIIPGYDQDDAHVDTCQAITTFRQVYGVKSPESEAARRSLIARLSTQQADIDHAQTI